MTPRSRWHRFVLPRLAATALASLLALSARALPLAAQATGTVTGRVTDDNGAAVSGAQIYLTRPAISAQTLGSGAYTLNRVPAGAQTLHVRMLGFRPDSASVTVTAGGTATQDFALRRDPLQLETMIVTATQTPRTNLDASVAVTTLSAQEVQRSAPRSTTEMLRYVPGFTRVESSGGEVNGNISIRGILGVEYVMFMEDGMPVYPTMHTFFMNADNLFRFDENIDRMEVVRGGASALFGSNTPGAIINFINKTGGDRFAGTMRATAGTKALARYDLNAGGPLGENWRFNVGGFYRYDHGVRDPGYPGIRGGQLKANVTRQLSNGYIRASIKYIDDRNQFILPLPFNNPESPEYVSGFSNYGAFNTNEGLDLRVPTPAGDLTLPLDNGLKTQATWFTVDAALDLTDDWHLQNTAQVMQNDQEHNAIVPGNALPAADFVAGLQNPDKTAPLPRGKHHPVPLHQPLRRGGSEAAVRHPERAGGPRDRMACRQAHLGDSGPASAPEGFRQTRPGAGRVLRQLHPGQPLELHRHPDGRAGQPALPGPGGDARRRGTPVEVTQNGFRNFLSTYANGSGQTSIVSGTLGAEIQLTDRLRADIGGRVEYDSYVQSSERTSTFDLDNNPATTYDNEVFGNGSFRQFSRDITDWAASVGLNFRMNDNIALYASGSRGYKMPALDDFLQASAQEQVDLFDAREVQSVEGGVKTQVGRAAVHGERLLHQSQERRRSGPRGGGWRHHLGHPEFAREPLLRRRDRGLRVAGARAPAPGQRHPAQGRAGWRGRQPGPVHGPTSGRGAHQPRQRRGPVFAGRGSGTAVQGGLALGRLAASARAR